MKLAKLIHSALVNPELRLALETGTLHVAEPNQVELAAAAEVMRYSRRVRGNGSLFRSPGHGRGLISSPDGWSWKQE